jgi:hypothetical protein
MLLLSVPRGLVTFRQDRCNLGPILSYALVFVSKKAGSSVLLMPGT